MKEQDAKELLRRYRLGLCTEREKEIVNYWYKSLATRAEKDAPWDWVGGESALRDTMLDAIEKTIGEEERKGPPGRRAFRMRNIHMPAVVNILRIAAVLIASILAVTFFLDWPVLEGPQSEAVNMSAPALARPPSRVYLSDGSVVWLKGTSTLDFPKTFTGPTREVTLRGEAFFEISKDRSKPFIIHTAHLTTRVLGTSFNIRDCEDADSMEVAVMTGKVSVMVKKDVSEKATEVILTPNQKAVYSAKKSVVIKTSPDEIKAFESFGKSKFIFNDVSLEHIVYLLNDRYDVEIRLDNKRMKGCIITADLSTETLQTSLEILARATGSEFQINEESILLKGPGCELNQ